jgi:membrane associated rhomboid family serine protease
VTPVVRALLFANIAVYFLQQTVPGVTSSFSFIPRYALLQPWTIVTYMFLHDPRGIMHILFNMLSLFFFGPRVESVIGSRRFTVLWFLSGISGAALSFALSPNAALVGASAGVFGVMMGFAHFWPDQVIMIWGIIPVPARLLVILTTVFAFWMGFTGSRDGVAHFAHLGGYAGAWLYLLWLDRSKKAFRRKAVAAAPEVAERVDTGGWKAIDVSKIHQANRDEVNRILDKINAAGVGSLTAEERLFLSNFVPVDDRPGPVH